MDEDDLSDDDNLEVNNISNITLYEDHNNSNDSIGSSIIREFPTPTMWKCRKLLEKSKLTSDDFNIIEESENEDLNNFQSLEKRLHTTCDEYKQLKIQLDIFQKQNKELQSEHKELVEYRCGIRVAPDVAADYRSNYQNQIECLQLQLKEAKDSNELLRNENKNYEEKNRNLLKEKEICEQEKIMIETKYELLQKKFNNRDADLCSNIDALNMQITQLENKISNIEKENESQRLEYETMSQQLVDALSENDSLLCKITKSDHDEQLRIEEIKNLTHKLEECKITNNSLNTITLETDAIEYRNKIQSLEHQEQLRIKEIKDLNDILNEFKIKNNTVNRITSESDDALEYRNKIQKLELNENALINQIQINEKLLKNSELKIAEIQQMCTEKDAAFLIASNYINEMKSKIIEIKIEHNLLMQQLEKIQILSTNLETQNLELNQKLLSEKSESLSLNEKYMKLLDSQKIFNNNYDVIRKIKNSLNSIQSNNNNNKQLNSITLNDLYVENLINDIHLIENNINQFLQNSIYDNEFNDTKNNEAIINFKKEIFYKISDYENSTDLLQKYIKKLFELHQKYFQSINNNDDSVCNSEDKQFLNEYNDKFSSLEITLNNNTRNNIPKITITDGDTFEKLKSNYEQLQINFIQMENSNKLLHNEIDELYSEKKNLDTIIERNRIVIEETSEDFSSLRSKYILIREIIENLHIEKSDIQKNYAQIQQEFNSFKNVLKNANLEFANFFIELLNLHQHTQSHDDDDEMDNRFIRLTDNVLDDTLNCFKYTKYNYKLLFNEYNTIFEQHYKSQSEKSANIENLNISHFENSIDLKQQAIVPLVDEETKRLTENGEEITETVNCDDQSLSNEIVEELNNEKLILLHENSLHLKLDLNDKFDKPQLTSNELQHLYDEKLTEIQILQTKVLNTEQLNIELINKLTTLQDLYNEKLIEIDTLNEKIINIDKFEVLQSNHLQLEESYNQKLSEIEKLNIKFVNVELLNNEMYDKLQVFQSKHLKLQASYDDKLVELESLNTKLLNIDQLNNESINKYTKLQDLYNEKLIEIDTLIKKSINIEELNNEINTELTTLQLKYSNLNKLHNEKQIEIDTLTVKLLDAEQLNEKQKTIQFDLIENIKKKDKSLKEQMSINNLINNNIYELEIKYTDLNVMYNKQLIEYKNCKELNIKNCNLNEIETLTTKLTKFEQLNSLQIDKLNEVQSKYCELEKNHSIKLIEIEILTEKLLTNELLINKQTEELNQLNENSNQLHNDKLNEIENLTIKLCDIKQLNTVQIENFNKLQNEYLDLDKFHNEKLNEIQILNEKLLTNEQVNSVQNEKLTKLQIEYAQLQSLYSKQLIEIENLNKNLKQIECNYQTKIKQYESVIEKITKKYTEFKSDSSNDKNGNNSTTAKQLKKNLQNILLEHDNLQLDENLRSERKSLQNERKSRRHATYDENRPTLQSDILKEIVDLSFSNIDSSGSGNNSLTSNNNSNSNNNNVQQCQNCIDFENIINDLRKELKVKNYQIIHNKMQIDHNPLLGEVDDLKNELKKSEQNNQRLRNDIKNINYKLQKVTSSNDEQRKKCNECENKKSVNEQETQTNVSGSNTDPQNKQQLISLMSCENDLVSQVRSDEIKNELLSLQKKYDEVKKICRLRRTTIMDLENKILKLTTNESMEIIKKESIQLREQFNEFNEKLKKVQSEKDQYLQKRDELHKDFNRLQKLHCKTKLEMQLENDSLKEKIAALQNSLTDKENDSKIAENLNSLELISQLQEENVLIKKNIMDLQLKCDRYKKQHLKNLQFQSTNKSDNHQSVQTEEYDFDKKLLEEINVYKCKYKKAKDICESRLRQIQFLEDKCKPLH